MSDSVHAKEDFPRGQQSRQREVAGWWAIGCREREMEMLGKEMKGPMGEHDVKCDAPGEG